MNLNINLMVKQNEQSGEDVSIKTPNVTTFKGLKPIASKLMTDTFEVSKKVDGGKKMTKALLKSMLKSGKRQSEIAAELSVAKQHVAYYIKKYGLNTLNRTSKKHVPITREKLQELANKGLSLQEMAAEMKIKVGRLRLHLDKHNIATGFQEEFRVLKEYFSATTRESKAKAFEKVDKYLQEIAKERLSSNGGISYEDCLQDVRLSFFELEKKSHEAGTDFPRTILTSVRTQETPNMNQIKTVGLEDVKETNPAIVSSDIQTISFESDDYLKRMKEHLRPFFRNRNYQITLKHVEDGETMKELAKQYSLSSKMIEYICYGTLQRAREIIENPVLGRRL